MCVLRSILVQSEHSDLFWRGYGLVRLEATQLNRGVIVSSLAGDISDTDDTDADTAEM